MTMKVLFLISLFTLQSATAAEQQDWILQKSQDGIKIYTKDVADSPMKAFKGTTLVLGTLDQYETILRDITHFTDWMDSLRLAEVKEQLEKNKRIVYTVYDAPWPLGTRDAVIHSSIEKLENKITHTVSLIPGYMPESDEYVRMPHLESTLSFMMTDSKEIEVTYEGHINPGGQVPAWAANSVVEDSPYQTLLNLQKMSL